MVYLRAVPSLVFEWYQAPKHRFVPSCVALSVLRIEQATWLTGAVFSRSPSSALSHPFFGWEGSPTRIHYRKRNGTLILTQFRAVFGGPSFAAVFRLQLLH